MKNISIKIILTAVVIILLIPLIAMQFTDEVNWNLPDFIVAGVLLLGTGLACELVLRKVKNIKSLKTTRKHIDKAGIDGIEWRSITTRGGM